ncbi:hypothetical protein ACIQ6R_36875 [Streptomyces sp. NPDC096048]|uniref:hypothetical protein n=1 Tax=Streptomyces sp. NPDC096048 TaxID=3366072 RepID=UPI003807D526
MSGDEKNGPVRRPRPIERPLLPAGALGDLKALVYELYLEAGAPSLAEIAAWVAGDDQLQGAPEKDTIHRIIRDRVVPSSQADVVAVVTVLARAARWDHRDAAGRARALWVAARMDPAVGVPIAQVTDPFAFEVHRPVNVEEEKGRLPTLPLYVRRAHDQRLAQIVERAAGGVSAMAVLVAGSSTGKTRACWEALEPLRREGRWWLWHPYDPTRPEAASEALDRVGPRTVVWLNETQEYLGGRGETGERVAAKLRRLLADPARAPVLVLGTLWPEHHADLTHASGTQVRQVLDGTVIEVPETFTGTDLAALRRAAGSDARLAWAAEHTNDGHITQYLAGAPALLERFHTAPPTANALICAAMDARRMGHRTTLPHALLEQAALAYLTDAQWDQLSEDWFDQALAYTAKPCKGARGPVTQVRLARALTGRQTTPASDRSDGRATYRLADYLDQYGRTHRVGQIPPPGFWSAMADCAHPGDLAVLGDAAWARGLFRDAAQLHKNATARGNQKAALRLVDLLRALYPEDRRPADWVAAHFPLDDPAEVAWLLGNLRIRGANDQAVVLADRAASRVPLHDANSIAWLLDRLREMGAQTQIATLLARAPAAHAVLDDPSGVTRLLDVLREAGADAQIAELLARDPASHIPLDDLDAVARLLHSLRRVGAEDQVATLADRTAAHSPLDDSHAVVRLLKNLRETGAETPATALADRAALQVPVDNPFVAAWLLENLREMGAQTQIATLLARAPAAHAVLDDPSGVTRLLDVLREAGADAQIAELLARDPAAHIPLDFNDKDGQFRVAKLLGSLRSLGAEDQVATLAGRAATQTPLDDPYVVAKLLGYLGEIGAESQIAELLARDPGTHVLLHNSGQSGVTTLLRSLREAGAEAQAAVLVERAATRNLYVWIGITSPLKDRLRTVEGETQIAELLAHDPVAQAALSDPRAVTSLLRGLREAGADVQAAALAEYTIDRVALEDQDPAEVAWLLENLREAGADARIAELLARDPVSKVAISTPSSVVTLLNMLREVGAEAQATALADRAAAHAPLDSRSVHLLYRLREAGAGAQAAALAERAVGHVPLDDLLAVCDLLDALSFSSRSGTDTQIAALLARDPATHVPVDTPVVVARLLHGLWRVGAEDQTTKLADRAAAHAPLHNPSPVDWLLGSLQEVGAAAQATVLKDRLVTEGRFDQFLNIDDNKLWFRFGREPDGTPAIRWAWESLE